jgi:hypothetical protein
MLSHLPYFQDAISVACCNQSIDSLLAELENGVWIGVRNENLPEEEDFLTLSSCASSRPRTILASSPGDGEDVIDLHVKQEAPNHCVGGELYTLATTSLSLGVGSMYPLFHTSAVYPYCKGGTD